MLRKTMNVKTDRRIQAVVLLGGLLLMATALAGCTEAPTATASQLRPTADSHAADWHEGAALVMVVGSEGTFEMQNLLGHFGSGAADSDGMQEALAADFWSRIQEDPEPGDGRGMFWLYVYRGDGDDHLVVVVDKDREVLYSDVVQGSDLGEPIGSFTVDSDEAMQIARAQNTHLEQATTTGSFGFVISLFKESPGDNPAWLVAGGGGSVEGGGGGIVILDAVTGEVLENEGGSGAPSEWSGGWS
jgi:hypothetical protein